MEALNSNARDQRALKLPPHALPSESMPHKNSIQDACAMISPNYGLGGIRNVCQNFHVPYHDWKTIEARVTIGAEPMLAMRSA